MRDGRVGARSPTKYPRMKVEWATNTESKLTPFRGGKRENSAQMTTISARMSDREIKAVSDYIAGLR